MSTLSSHSTDLPPEQQAIRAKCFHPTGTFIEFKKEAVEQSIPDRFEEQVRRHPNRLAVKARSQRLTYTELNQSANRVARAVLAQEGNGQETVVLMFEHGAQVLIAILGVLKAGRVYVPLDPTYPRIRISHMLEDSQPSLIITNNQNLSLAHELARAGCRLINIDELDVSLPADDLGRSITPDSLASVFYTSGSTGQPKGVVHNHRNLLHMTRNFTNTFRICASDRLSFLYSSSFIGGAKDTFGALLNGATVCPFDIGMDGLTQLADWLAQEEITIYGSVATVFRRLGSTLRGGDQFPKLRLIIVGGERVNKEIVALYTKYFSSRCIFVTGLGATEINFACGYFIGANSQIEGSTLPVGYPVEGIKALILDDDGQRVDSNQVGEIAIQSRYLSPGYWHRPDLTQLAFRADPNGGEERIYLTGDLGRMLADGCLEHLGRKDFQVKVRGYRVEVAEIEMALLELVSIKEVVVVAREVPTGDQRLVAYLVPATELAPSFDELRSHLREKLPDYMVPPAFVFLDALPTLPNGKVNRRGLPSAGNARQALDNDYLAPRTESEETLVRIWAEFLGLDQVGVHDNFLGLGGDSLLAGQVSSRIRDSFQVEIPVRRLFETPTVAGLAAVIEEVKNSSVEVQLPAMVSISRQSHRVSMSPTGTVESPTSFAQQRLWFLDQLEPDNSAYNIPVALRLSGLLNVSALEQSLNEIVRRHETLRTTISTDDGQPVQAICPTFTFNIPVLDLRILTRAEREAGAQELVDKEAQRPFDLAQGPLFRTTLLRLNEEEHIFLLTMHHIICDGWSRAVLCRELAALYEAFSTGRPSPLPELPLQYADFAQWQREWLQGEVLESQLAYWKVQLDGIPPLMELPTDRPRPAVQTYRGAKQSLVLSKSLSQSLKALGQRERVTRFMTLLAAFQTLLHRYTGQDDILVGSPIAGRTRIETEELIGFFVNTLVLRGDFSGEPTFRELLGRVREKALEAYDHQDLPFEKLVDELRSERNLSHSPLFQAMFVLQNTPAQVLELPGLILNSLDVESGTAKFDLTLNLTETELGLSGYLEYNTDLFDAATIDRMLGHFQTLLESIAADPDQPVSTLPLLTEAERHQLLVEWNDTKSEYPQDKCIHELFEEQVERTPDAVAVVFEDQHLTYRELNRRANQLAHHLRSLGVVPEVLVGICVESGR